MAYLDHATDAKTLCLYILPMVYSIMRKDVISALTKVYRNYCFYIAPGKLVIRDTVKQFFLKRSPCPKVLEVGGGAAMMKDLLRSSCRSKQFISSDIAPSENTDVVCDA